METGKMQVSKNLLELIIICLLVSLMSTAQNTRIFVSRFAQTNRRYFIPYVSEKSSALIFFLDSFNKSRPIFTIFSLLKSETNFEEEA